MTLAAIQAEHLTFFLAPPLIYLVLVALGRWMKRRLAIPVGILYQLFCIVLAFYLPLRVTDTALRLGELDLRRELSAAAILLGALFGIAVFGRFFWDGYFRRVKGAEAPRFMRELIALVVAIAALLVVLGAIYGVRVPGLLAGSGIAAIILGLALQDLLGNVISGIALEIGRPFRAGDWLKVDGDYGQVIDANWRAVRLVTNDDVVLEIPNSTITKSTIVNLTSPARAHAVRLNFGIEYGVPPNRVKDILAHAARHATGVIESPPPRGFVVDFGDSAITYQIKFYLEDHRLFNAARDAVLTNVWYELRRVGITIPFPIRTIHIEPRPKPPEPNRAALEALQKQPLFASLPPEDIRSLVAAGHQIRFGRQELILEEGAAGDSMFIMIAGEASVMVETHSGGQASVGMLRAGDCFGEMSLLTGENRSATVTANEDCEVIEIDKEAFRSLLEKTPHLLDALGELLAERRVKNEEALEQLSSAQVFSKKREYADSFFKRLSAYFGL